MPLELQTLRPPALAEHEPALLPARRGAELAHLAEEFYVRLFAVACVFVLAGCALTLCFTTLARGAPGPTTALFVAAAAALAVAGLARPRRVYCGLRARSGLQLAPAGLGALAVLLDGPESECWWIALPLPWVVATVSSMPVAISAAVVTAIAWVVGTAIGGQALITEGDLGILPATVALPTYTLIACILIDGFVGLVLERHRFTAATAERTPPPLRVANLATAPTTRPASTAAPTPPGPRRSKPVSRLTAREFEVTLLLRDGLRQTEIAACLGISTRQVERLLATARHRVHATTTTELVAMLARGALTSMNHQPTPSTATSGASGGQRPSIVADPRTISI